MTLKTLFEMAETEDWAAYLIRRSQLMPSGCLEWQGSRLKQGYGSFGRKGKRGGVHRLAYEIVFGAFPSELQVCHKCDNPPCLNPDHLFLGTNEDNQNDKIAKGRHAKGPAQVLTTISSKLRHPPSKENPSLPVGVTWLARLGKYRVQIGGKPRRHVGVYKTVEEAAAAYHAEVEKAIQSAKENLV